MDLEATSLAARVDDRAARAIGCTVFALVIPHALDLYGPLGPADAMYWAGFAIFGALSLSIWHGNRWLLFKQREHLDWFARPLSKILVLLFGIVCFTVPLTVAVLHAWFAALDRPADADAIRTCALVNVICVVFVAHVYETVFLIKERELDMDRVQKLERARARAELDALSAQIDPHFLFNSLNTMAALVDADPARARVFVEDLARVYRYVLRQRGRDLVLLADELAFLESYARLLATRFGDAVHIELTCEVPADRRLIVPAALQLLVENAVKHNRFTAAQPMRIEITIGEREVCVANPRRRKPQVLEPGTGLHNLAERVRLTLGRPLAIEADEERFAVRLPLEPTGRA